MSLKGVAKQVVAIIERGAYESESGAVVSLAQAQSAAERGTRVYTAAELRCLAPGTGPAQTALEVTDESTQEALFRLWEEGERDLLALNFASAKNAGGGFLSGAKAQEEDLCRCSGLHACLMGAPDYYRINRAESSMLYTDTMIYSPGVPFFRVSSRGPLVDDPVLAAVITAPAPNAGAARGRSEARGVEETMRRRARLVLTLAAERGHRNLVLGAWGCGVFRNDPAEVADAFAVPLAGELKGAFDRVVFAIYARGAIGQANLLAFQQRLCI